MKRISKIFSVIMVCALMILTTACGKDNTSFTHGTWNGTTYTSKFLGMKATVGSDWVITSDAELATAFGISDMSDSNIQSVLDKLGTITEMMATKPGGSSVNITIQDFNTTGGKMNEDEYFKSGIELLKQQLSGYNATAEEGKVVFLGKSTRCINITLPVSGQTVYEVQIPVFKSHYIASITFAATTKADAEQLLGIFTAA